MRGLQASTGSVLCVLLLALPAVLAGSQDVDREGTNETTAAAESEHGRDVASESQPGQGADSVKGQSTDAGQVAPQQQQTSPVARPPATPKFQKIYELLDRDDDGSLDSTEFLQGSIGKAAASKLAKFKESDQNGDGFLSLDEYQKVGWKRGVKKAPDPETEMRSLDSDGDGSLNLT